MTTDANALAAALSDRYRIERELGAGGMAIVHLAHDLRHDRRVALKVLRPELAAVIGAERFLAEIRTTANLQHPHILPLFDSGQVNGTVFYVMPFVKGESLRSRLTREKQLPVDEAVRIAKEVADALEHAHAHGVIHRDIKPENILLQGSHALVADFGIALAAARSDGGNRLTETGMSLGTPHYMSPEQATGQRELDGRTDIYALACVLYELLAGEPPFTGPTPQAIIAKVMTTDPVPVTALRPTVPESVARALRSALQKIPADRPASAARFAAMLEEIAPPTVSGTTAGTGTAGVPRSRASRVARSVAWVAAVSAAALGGWWLGASRTEPTPPVTRFVLDLPREQAIQGTGQISITISPDGRTVAWVVQQSGRPPEIAFRRIDQLLTRLVPGSEGVRYLRFAPDGQSLIALLPAGMFRVTLDGSTRQVVMPGAPGGSEAIVTGSGEIIGNRRLGRLDNALSVIHGSGGTARALAAIDTAQGETQQRAPLVLGDGKTILYLSHAGGIPRLSRLGIVSIDRGPATILPINALMPLGYVDGHVIYVRPGGIIAAVPVDLPSRRVTGEPIDLGEEVAQLAGFNGAFAGLSNDGTLVYVRRLLESTPVLVDTLGTVTPIDTVRRSYNFPRFSPDGRRIVWSVGEGLRSDIWVYDLATGTSTPLTNGGLNDRPEWSPDGRRVVYRADRGDQVTLWSQPIDGSGGAERFVNLPQGVHEGVFTPDGRSMVIRTQTAGGRSELHLMPLAGDRTLRPILAAKEQFVLGPRVSPDGQWLAYGSDESGNFDVYVRRLDGEGVPARVSLSGGTEPVWSRDGARLFYRLGSRLLAATLKRSPSGLEVERRDLILDGSLPLVTNAVRATYDLTPDGKKFLVLQRASEDQIVVVVNWLAEVRARLAAGKKP